MKQTTSNSLADIKKEFEQRKWTTNDDSDDSDESEDEIIIAKLEKEMKKSFRFTVIFSKCFFVLYKCFSSCFLKIKNLLPKKHGNISENHQQSNQEQIQEYSWKIICDLMINSFEKSIKEADSGKNNPKKIHLNFSNIVEILLQIFEAFMSISIGFTEEIGWEYSRNASIISGIILASKGFWKVMFWISLGLNIIFLIFLILSPKIIENQESNQEIQERPTKCKYIFGKILSLIGGVCYFTIMCAILSSFSCSYDPENDTWNLLNKPNIKCFGNDHIIYLVISIITLFTYYLAATLILPSIHYASHDLDLKFDTTFVVLESQGKLLIATFAVLFDKTNYIVLQLIVTIIVNIFLCYLTIKMKPCFIKSYNIWKTATLLLQFGLAYAL